MDEERRSEKRNTLLQILLKKYFRSLQTNPILTKSLTSAIVSFTANIAGQLIDKHKGILDELQLPPALRYASFGFVVTGPVMHYFYTWLMKAVPGKDREAMIKRLLIERIILTPVFLLLFHSYMAGLEHRSWEAVQLRLQAAYWLTLTMNWKYYTVAQVINFRFIPPELKVLFGNFCGFLWTIALTSLKPKAQ